jgi:hypothetical protein
MAARLALCAALVAAAALPAVAGVHRWVDEQGQVHYGDRPMSASASTLRIRAESATAPATAPAAPAAAAAKPPAGSSPSTADRTPPRQRPTAPAPQAAPAAQTTPSAQAPGMASLIAQCKANRGVDCETPQGMRNLQRENTPITREEQSRIAGLRARRASCSRAPGSLGC